MAVQFHETIIGHRILESSIPKAIKALEEIAYELKRQNDLKEEELKLKEKENENA